MKQFSLYPIHQLKYTFACLTQHVFCAALQIYMYWWVRLAAGLVCGLMTDAWSVVITNMVAVIKITPD